MSGEGDGAVVEGGAAEHVVGVGVGADDVGDRQVGERLDARAQTPAERGTAAGVDDRGRMRSDHHPRVSDRAKVPGSRLLVRAHVDMDSLGHLLEPERLGGGGRDTEREAGGEANAPAHAAPGSEDFDGW